MLKKIGKILLIILAVLVVLVTAIAIIGPSWTRNKAEESFPIINGELTVDGLEAPVDIYRDNAGIPHIYASSEHDLFFAQGYVHAQDRFWQMDFWRHQGTGTLSEMMGESTLDTDKFLRSLGWGRIAEVEYANMPAEKQAILQDYAAGVNAYLADHKGTALSLEYAFLPIINADYEPDPWEPIHTLTWAKAMAWELGRSKLNGEIDYAKLLKDLSQEQIDFIFPDYPEDHPYIVPNPHITGASAATAPANTDIIAALFPALQQAGERVSLLGTGDSSAIGSNNWVIAGELTDTRMPLLANDMHLGVQMPSIWYLNGLHCAPVSDDCALDAVGFSFAGTPAIVVGHNAHHAWGFTNVGPDVADLYIEKINPENPNQYEFQGEWVDMELVTETINVAGGDPVEFTVQITRHGPIITDTYGLEEFHNETGVELPENYALSLRWAALDATCVMCALVDFSYAENWGEFRAAAAQFAAPAQNIVYADIEGNIGYQTPGNIPIRAEGHSGLHPVPGWTGDYEWGEYIAFEDLPFAYNPPEGYIATANNAVAGPEYPYLIANKFEYGFRAQRIVELIEGAPGPIDAAYIEEIHADTTDLLARELLPILLELPVNENIAEYHRPLLSGWDYRMDMDSAPALMYAAFWKKVMAKTYQDDLPEFYWPEGGSRWMEVTRRLLKDPTHVWWDDQTTPEVETRDDILMRAFEAAVEEVKDIAGKDPADWAWGDVHGTTFENQVMSNFPFISNAFNRGPFPTAGGNSIVNANAWSSLEEGYGITWLVSERAIMDTSDWQASTWINTTGQSGHAYHPHYIDMADPWRLVKYVPQHWERESVEADAEGHLRLTNK